MSPHLRDVETIVIIGILLLNVKYSRQFPSHHKKHIKTPNGRGKVGIGLLSLGLGCRLDFAETFHATAAEFRLLLPRVDGVAVAADFHLLLLNGGRNDKHRLARGARGLCVLEYLRVNSCLHSREIVQEEGEMARGEVCGCSLLVGSFTG
jgi:hypothetical protein